MRRIQSIAGLATRSCKTLIPITGLLLAAVVAMAATGTETLSLANMGMGLFGGLALFLFGMDQLAQSLQAAAGDRMKAVLARLTRNRVTAAASGAFVTAVLQSSSVTTVLVVGFITAGLMSLTQSIGIIMGANVGTTVTAQIVAFKVTELALALIAVGFTLLFFSKRDTPKEIGGILMGLGLLFFGMGVMSDVMSPLRTYQPFIDLMAAMESPVLGILVAAGFTALVQSSSATTGLVVVLAAQGFVSLPAGIAMALGANIGTCITALLAAIGKPRDAVRSAFVHVLFNVLGVLLWVAFIPQLSDLATAISPSHMGLSGIERLAAETPRQIANANTVFNLANTLIFLPLAGVFASLVLRIVPDKPTEAEAVVEPKYLDDELVGKPSLALDRVRLELGQMGGIVSEMLWRISPALLRTDRRALAETARLDDDVDRLYQAIVGYLGEIRKEPLSDEESRTFTNLMSVTESIENIGDVIADSLVPVGYKALDTGVELSEAMRHALTELHQKVSRALESALKAISDDNAETAREVLAAKREINRDIDKVLEHQAARLSVGGPHRIAVFSVEMQAVDDLKRIYNLAKRVARAVAPKKAKQKAS